MNNQPLTLDPGPGDAVEAASGLGGKFVEGTLREVEVGQGAACAAVRNGDGDALALVISLDLLVADGVAVRVRVGVAGIRVKEIL